MHHVQPTHSPVHVRANIFLLWLMTCGQALMLLGVLVRSAGLGPHVIPPEAEPPKRAETARKRGRRKGKALGMVLLWAPLCAIAQIRRRGWARAATMGYRGLTAVGLGGTLLPLVLLSSACAFLQGERRPPPSRVTSSTLDAHRREAVEAFISFHRQYGGLSQEAEVSGVYFSQADWEIVRGLTGSMRQASVVFITRDNDGCEWSSWTLAQKSLGEDGWAMAQLLPGPLDRDAISCQALEPSR